MAAHLKPLRRRGLVEGRPGPAEGRSRLLSLTPAGRALLAEATPPWERTQAEAEAALAAGEADRLRAGLRALEG